MERTILRKFRPHTACEKKMKPIKTGKRSKSRDDIVYIFNDGNYLLLKVEDVNGNVLHCSEISATERIFKRHNDLNFGLVGVFKDFGKRNIYHNVRKSEIHGKLIRSRGLVLTAPKNVLIDR